MFLSAIFFDYLKSMLIWFFYSLQKQFTKMTLIKVCLLDKLPYISGSTDHIKVNQIKTKYLNTSGWNKVIHVYDIYACQYLHTVRAVSKKKKKKVWKKNEFKPKLSPEIGCTQLPISNLFHFSLVSNLKVVLPTQQP